MHHADLFQIHHIHAEATRSGAIKRITAVDVHCHPCDAPHRLDASTGFDPFAGAGVLSCPGCGGRQALSWSRFEELMDAPGAASVSCR